MLKKVTIYTDGACRGNPGPGGWGAVLIYGEIKKELSGSEPHTTNNRMELQAAIEALAALSAKCEVAIYTDSTYVRDGITRWIHQWKQKNWRGAANAPVKNVDLWQRLDTLNATHDVTWHWVRGHNGDPNNTLADQLAVAASRG